MLNKQKFHKRGVISFYEQTMNSANCQIFFLDLAPKQNRIQTNCQQLANRTQNFQIYSIFGTVELSFSKLFHAPELKCFIFFTCDQINTPPPPPPR